ncbi:hypothetical protein FHS25_003407 [Rhizobium laguerreae]|uniref:Uncharacterized protein n=1 Tax=Rhizobium laguerreae TaxID=1076926 RepID=A0ABR6G9I9_9HYPH|nr:hypothetical protein [Rhizobium laguerreae]
MNVAVFIAHDRGAAGARAMDMIDLADLVMVGSIDGGTFEDGRRNLKSSSVRGWCVP